MGSGQKKLVSTVAGRSGITTVPLRLAFSPGCTCCSFPVPLPSSPSFPHPRHCLQTDTFQIKISAVAALIKSPYSPLLPPESSSQNWPRLCSLPFCCPLPLASPDHAPRCLKQVPDHAPRCLKQVPDHTPRCLKQVPDHASRCLKQVPDHTPRCHKQQPGGWLPVPSTSWPSCLCSPCERKIPLRTLP